MVERKPHILLVGGDGAPSGVPQHICDLAAALKPLARVTVVSEPDRGGFASLEARHVEVAGLASRMRPGPLRAGYQGLLNVMREEAADLVWLHARMPVILGRMALRRGDYAGKLAVTFHGLPFGRGHRRALSTVSKRIEARLAKGPRHEMVFLTQTQKAAMEAHLGPLAARHGRQVLGNASHLGPLPAREEVAPRHLVMTGRAGWQKNLQAAAALVPHVPEDTVLSMCGPGTDDPRVAAKLRAIAGDRLRLLGPLKDVRPLLAAADGYLLPSRYEGEPIGALEAWEAGLPVFLAPFEGAKELARHSFSQVFDSTDPARRAAQIVNVLDRYLSDRPTHAAQIRESWARHHAPDRFATEARALVERWLAT